MQYHITANPYAPSSNAKDTKLTLSQLFNNKMCQQQDKPCDSVNKQRLSE